MAVNFDELRVRPRLNIADFDPANCATIRSNQKDWETSAPGIVQFRAKLLAAQKHECAYCRTRIWADQNGLREIDHVLPKNPTPKLDMEKACSPDFDHRTHTFGYRHFRFEPRNFAIACKQCNTFKSNFDPLRVRDHGFREYPSSPDAFLWVHPFYHSYSDNIRVSPNILFESLTPEGDAVITVCKLADPEVLARRHVAQVIAARMPTLLHFLHSISGQWLDVSPWDAALALHTKFHVELERAKEIVGVWWECASDPSPERSAKAYAAVDALAWEQQAINS